MSTYHLFGSINSVFILLSLLGIASQLEKIWHRKRSGAKQSTELLSLNQFMTSFMAYFAFFVYAYSITPLNHYLLWPRLLACLLVLAILFEVMRDRKSRLAKRLFTIAMITLIAGCIGGFFAPQIQDESRLISTTLLLSVSVALAQGYRHQIKLIRQQGQTGALSLRMNLFILLMDVSTLAFAISMGIANGWPLMVLASVSGATKVIILYLFYWAKHSELAALRRRGAFS